MTVATVCQIGDVPLREGVEHPDERHGGAEIGIASAVASSVRGRLHIRNGVPRDDAFAAAWDGAWVVAAVADGLGSRPFSRYGASCAANSFCSAFLSEVAPQPSLSAAGPPAAAMDSARTSQALLAAFRRTRSEVEGFASSRALTLDAVHCTLLALALNLQTRQLAVGQVGDGLIVGVKKSTEAGPLIDPDLPAEPGSTYSLTQAGWEKHLRLDSVNATAYKAFFLLTDGVADDCQYPPPDDILRRWSNQVDGKLRGFAGALEASEWLRSYLASYHVRGSFDDRTLLAVLLKGELTVCPW